MSGSLRVFSGVLLVTAALSALPAAAQAASSIVSISVPLTQIVEGTTSLVVSSAVPVQRGRLTIKSNVSWILKAQTNGATVEVAWRAAGDTTWQPLGASTPVLRGVKGVHEVEYEVRQTPGAPRPGQPVTVTFSVEPAAAD